jgi:hypothetical protein
MRTIVVIDKRLALGMIALLASSSVGCYFIGAGALIAMATAIASMIVARSLGVTVATCIAIVAGNLGVMITGPSPHEMISVATLCTLISGCAAYCYFRYEELTSRTIRSDSSARGILRPLAICIITGMILSSFVIAVSMRSGQLSASDFWPISWRIMVIGAASGAGIGLLLSILRRSFPD